MDTESESTRPGSEEMHTLSSGTQEREQNQVQNYSERSQGIKNIQLSGGQLVITAELSGVFCQGIQYYDLRNILFINNAGMASLIDLLKSLLKQGVDVRFVNVNEKIRKKIKDMGLDHILRCT
jgi:ABC-type transporter Mla MlaB component